MNDPREEHELEAYLAGDTPVSKRYARMGREEPPAELDAAILSAAKTELKVVPISPGWRRWGAAVGIAATLVLAFSLILQYTIAPNEPSVAANYREPAAVAPVSPGGEAPQVERKRAAMPRGLSTYDVPGSQAQLREDTLKELREDVPSARGQDSESQDAPLAASAPSPEVSPTAPTVAVMKHEADRSVDARDLMVSGYWPESAKEISRAVAVIREFQGGEAVSASNEDPAGASLYLEEIRVIALQAEEPLRQIPPDEHLAERATDPEEADQALAEIVQRYDAGEVERAGELLDDFMLDYPEHPVALQLEEGLD